MNKSFAFAVYCASCSMQQVRSMRRGVVHPRMVQAMNHTLMALVLLAGLDFWLSASALEVYSAHETHMHTYVDTGDSALDGLEPAGPVLGRGTLES